MGMTFKEFMVQVLCCVIYKRGEPPFNEDNEDKIEFFNQLYESWNEYQGYDDVREWAHFHLAEMTVYEHGIELTENFIGRQKREQEERF